jgi:hypothetical protein
MNLAGICMQSVLDFEYGVVWDVQFQGLGELACITIVVVTTNPGRAIP